MKPVLVRFGVDDKTIMFRTEVFNMSGLSAADNKSSAVSVDSLADIAESDIVVTFRNLSDKIKPDRNSAPSIDFGY